MTSVLKDRRTIAIYAGEFVRGVDHSVQERARDKIVMIIAATKVEDVRIPPSNHLEKFVGKRAGQWSLRVNKQWRICFEWPEGASAASEIEIADYH